MPPAPHDNLGFDEGLSIPITAKPDFAALLDELGTVDRVVKEIHSNLETYASILGSTANTMQPLIQLSRDDLDIQRQLIEARKKALELADMASAKVRDTAAEQQKIQELAEMTGKIMGQPFQPQHIPDIPDIMLRQGMTQYSRLGEQAQQIFTGDLAPAGGHITEAMQALHGGHVGEGMVRVQQALEALGKENLKLTKQQAKAYEDLKNMAESLKKEAHEGAPAQQSLARRMAEQLNPDFFGPQAVQQSEQRLMRTFARHLPGGPEGGLAQGFRVITPELLKGLGDAVVPLAAAASVGEIAERHYVNMRNQQREFTGIEGQTSMGQVRGYDIQARLMAISPFVSDQQAREIIQGALREGYKGQTADNAIDFALDNFKRFNLTTGQSMELFQTNVVEAGNSVDKVSAQLDNLSKMAGQSSISMQTAVANAAKTSATLVGIGGGSASLSVATMLGSATANNPALIPVNQAGGLGAALSNPTMQALLARQLGTDPYHLFARLQSMQGQPLQLTQAVNDTITSFIGRALPRLGANPTEEELNNNAVPLMNIFQQLGIPVQTQEQAVEMAKQVLNNGGLTSQIESQAAAANKPRDVGFWRKAGATMESYGLTPHGFMNVIRGGGEEHAIIEDVARNRILHPLATAATGGAFDLNRTLTHLLPGVGGGLGKSRAELQDLYNRDVVGHQQSMPLVEELLAHQNVRDIAVSYKGEVTPLQNFLNKYGTEGFQALQMGHAQVANVGGFGAHGQPRHAPHWQTAAALTGNPAFDAAQQALGATGQSYQGMLELTNDAKKLVKLLDRTSGQSGVYNSLVESNAQLGLDNTNNQRSG